MDKAKLAEILGQLTAAVDALKAAIGEPAPEEEKEEMPEMPAEMPEEKGMGGMSTLKKQTGGYIA